MDRAYLVGVLGALMIVVAWASTIRSPPPPPRLSALYALGSLLLTVYAVELRDPVFTVLNALAALLAFANIVRARGKA